MIQDMPMWFALWVGLAVVFGVVELLTAGVFFVFLSGGALFAALASLLWPEAIVTQSVVFVVTSILLVVFARPLMRRWFQLGDKPAKASNVDALLGADVMVLDRVEKYQGRVKVVHTGESWSAYLSDNAGVDALEPGQVAEVVRVDGAKLVVQAKVSP